MHIIADSNTGEFLKQCGGSMPTKNTNRSERYAVGEFLRFHDVTPRHQRGAILAPPIAVPDFQGRRRQAVVLWFGCDQEDGSRMDAGRRGDPPAAAEAVVQRLPSR